MLRHLDSLLPKKMPPFTVDPAAIRTFKNRASLERWYARHAASAKELWIARFLRSRQGGRPLEDSSPC